MRHIFLPGKVSRPTLLLLHGTGGSEEDLLPLAEMLDPQASVLSVRGNVLEKGMSRFFRRLAPVVFDEEDLVFRTGELNDFLGEAAKEYGFDRDNVIALGYSNGANMAASLLFHIPNALQGAILFHPMVPRRGVILPSLSPVPVFIGAGEKDDICPPEETRELSSILIEAGVKVTIHWESNGHGLTETEAQAAAAWFRSLWP